MFLAGLAGWRGCAATCILYIYAIIMINSHRATAAATCPVNQSRIMGLALSVSSRSLRRLSSRQFSSLGVLAKKEHQPAKRSKEEGSERGAPSPNSEAELKSEQRTQPYMRPRPHNSSQSYAHRAPPAKKQ